MESNQLTLVAAGLGVGIQTLITFIQCYTAFKKSNVERFFEKLLASNVDISSIGKEENLQRYFFQIIDNVASEANLEKVDSWKNAVLHLANDFIDFEYKDSYLRVLSDLTVFDLTVLYKIYSTDFDHEMFESRLLDYFNTRRIEVEYVLQALKRLASHNLINENYLNTFTFHGTKDAPLSKLIYSKNDLGKKFLLFVSDLKD